MKFKIILLFSSLLMVNGVSALTIVEAYQAALKNDVIFKQACYELSASKSENRSDWGAILPQAVLEFKNTKLAVKNQGEWKHLNDTSNLTLSVSQQIFNMTTFGNLAISEQKRQQSQIVYLQAKQNLISRVISAYTDLLSAHQQLINSEKELEASETTAKSARAKYSVGTINQTDMNLAIAEESKNRASFLMQKSNLATVKMKLQFITGIDNIDSVEDIASDSFISQLPYQDFTLDKILSNNLNLKSLEMAISLANTGVAMSGASFLPTVNLVAQWSSTPTNQKPFTSGYKSNYQLDSRYIGLSISLPIFNGFRSVNGAAQAIASKDKIEQSYIEARQNIQVGYTKLFNGMSVNKESLRSLGVSTAALEKASTNAAKSYKASLSSIQNVLDAIKSYYLVKSQYEASRYNYVNNYITLKIMDNSLDENIFDELDKVFTSKINIK